MSLDSCHNIEDLRRRAKRKLPSPMFHYIDGGADDEWSLQRNSQAFDELQLLPNYLNDVSQVGLDTTLLGCDLRLPFLLAPTGMSRLFHHHKELGVARAAAKHGTLYTLSTMATTSLEDVAAAASGAQMFQIYVFKDRGLTRELIQRCKQSGYRALCLTVDTAVAGNRERDRRLGMSMPPRITPRTFFSFASSFGWLFNFARDPGFGLANVAHRVDMLSGGAVGVIEYVNSQFDRSVTWQDVEWVASEWGGAFAIKGMSAVGDAKRAVSSGATAAMLSNHGGRQLDGCAAPITTLPRIRDAIGDQLELIIDGGIRRGTHILKALALGANACSIGRPYLYGLAAGGEAGVDRALTLLRDEVARGLSLLGCQRISDVGRQHVELVDEWRREFAA
ncbi:alpha-hydroxy acid oxidase [Hydrocarboniphaga sp.]|uniref:alpha-hydroxy acid oxidase n=1 Tax=Hydrocarboniphaga sp. TaxID=2033016 RepID=UPI003D11721C